MWKKGDLKGDWTTFQSYLARYGDTGFAFMCFFPLFDGTQDSDAVHLIVWLIKGSCVLCVSMLLTCNWLLINTRDRWFVTPEDSILFSGRISGRCAAWAAFIKH